MPSDSMADAMVLAVYMPPQAPAPGHAFFSTAFSSSSRDLLGQPVAIGFERRYDVQLLVAEMTGADGAAVDDDARPVHARHAP